MYNLVALAGMDILYNALIHVNQVVYNTEYQFRLHQHENGILELKLCANHPYGIHVFVEVLDKSAGWNGILHIYGNTQTFTSKHMVMTETSLISILSDCITLIFELRYEPSTELEWEFEDWVSSDIKCNQGHIPKRIVNRSLFAPDDLWCIHKNPFLNPPVMVGDRLFLSPSTSSRETGGCRGYIN